MLGASVLTTNGPDAIVDWVRIEARSTVAPHAVMGARSALLQRDRRYRRYRWGFPVLLPVVPETTTSPFGTVTTWE